MARVDRTDGLRIYFESGDVIHLRPSGNADEFRVYACAGSRERATRSPRSARGTSAPRSTINKSDSRPILLYRLPGERRSRPHREERPRGRRSGDAVVRGERRRDVRGRRRGVLAGSGGSSTAKQYDKAERYAAESSKLSENLLRNRRLDADPWLPTAVGASIEVRGLVLAARGERADAIAYLNEQLAKYRTTSIAERIRKNINLLSLEGKRAPALEVQDYLGVKPPSLSSLRGHPVLLFFWAHWCPDCKALAPDIAALMKTYGPKGLAVIGPTRLYGYVAGGEDAAPAVERRYIEKVRAQFYAALADMPVPVSAQ